MALFCAEVNKFRWLCWFHKSATGKSHQDNNKNRSLSLISLFCLGRPIGIYYFPIEQPIFFHFTPGKCIRVAIANPEFMIGGREFGSDTFSNGEVPVARKAQGLSWFEIAMKIFREEGIEQYFDTINWIITW